MTTRRTMWKAMQFDHGCQFIRAASPEMRAAVARWEAAGVAAMWEGRVGELDAATGRFTPRDSADGGDSSSSGGSGGSGSNSSRGFLGVMGPGPLYVGVPSMDAICRHLADGGGAEGGGEGSGSAAAAGSGVAAVRCDARVSRALLDADGKQWLLEGSLRQPLRTAAERKQEPPFTPWNLGVFDALVLADAMAGRAGAARPILMLLGLCLLGGSMMISCDRCCFFPKPSPTTSQPTSQPPRPPISPTITQPLSRRAGPC